ncbi:MAG: hypothetical protein B1H11_03340 [Desulfobacteraceae bacterium 4484_190.1]|nr:MAG: hypothetical protein B1H11_03340 [Desulfobacteraceae bacterium 4484_190.1]
MLLGNLIRRNAKLFPDKTAIIFENKKITYHELGERTGRLCNGLKAMGIKKRDRVGLIQHPCPQFIELYIAIPRTGAVLVPLNCRLTGKELVYIVNDAALKMIILGREFIDVIKSIKPDLKTVTSYFCMGKTPSGMKDYEKLILDFPPEFSAIGVHDDDVAIQMYTSGTTGRPKGAMLTHKNLMSNYIGRIVDLKLDKEEIFLSATPYYHVAAEYALVTLFVGGLLIIHSKFDPGRFLSDIEAEKVTYTLAVPSMINFLLQYMEKHPGNYDFSTVKTFLYGASSMPVALLRKAMKAFKCNFIQSYGLTEASPGVTYLRPEDHILDGPEEKVKRLASCGKEVFNVEVRVINEKGAVVRPYEVGEIIVRGDNVMKGYWKLPLETAKTIKNGWLHTGDLAMVDEEGYIFIIDRKNDMIISGGENIYPREVEEILYEHPSVLDAAVIGIPDQDWGESVKAFVVLKDGEKVSEAGIIDFCKKNLASYKKPKSVEFIHELPRNPTGKVLKKELKNKVNRSSSRV